MEDNAKIIEENNKWGVVDEFNGEPTEAEWERERSDRHIEIEQDEEFIEED